MEVLPIPVEKAEHHKIWGSALTVNTQGLVTPISTALRAVTKDCDPVYGGCRCGLLYFPYWKKKSHSHSRSFAGSLAV